MRESAAARGRRMAGEQVEWLAKGKPLPGIITVEGIEHTVSAGVESGDFYR